MPKVSVIVPVYKVENYIRKCIESLKNQILDDIEIILVDDGSPDTCGQICDEYAAKDSRIRVLHKENGGVSAARNDGLYLATGEYVIFCDSDDWMEPEAFATLYKKAVETDADIVIGDVYQVYGEEKKKSVFYSKEFVTDDSNFISELIKADIYRTYCPLPPVDGPAFGYGGPWNKLVKRELLIQNDVKFDLRVKGIFDDILYTAYILAYAKKIAYVSVPVYNYRILQNSITHAYKPDVVEINSAIFNSWEELFKQLNEERKYNKPYYACVMRRIEESIKLYFANDKNTKSKKKLQKEFKEMLQSEPYYTAVRNVDISKVSKKQKVIAILSRINCASLVLNLNQFK